VLDYYLEFVWLNIFVQIVSSVDEKALQKFLSVHQEVASHLCKRSSEDQAYDVGLINVSL
jgi:cohesin loading factor subunit SCC2